MSKLIEKVRRVRFDCQFVYLMTFHSSSFICSPKWYTINPDECHYTWTKRAACYVDTHLNEAWRTLIKCQEARSIDKDSTPQPPAYEVGLLIIAMKFTVEIL